MSRVSNAQVMEHYDDVNQRLDLHDESLKKINNQLVTLTEITRNMQSDMHNLKEGMKLLLDDYHRRTQVEQEIDTIIRIEEPMKEEMPRVKGTIQDPNIPFLYNELVGCDNKSEVNSKNLISAYKVFDEMPERVSDEIDVQINDKSEMGFFPFDPTFFYKQDLEFGIQISLNELIKDNECFRNGKIKETIVDEVVDEMPRRNFEEDNQEKRQNGVCMLNRTTNVPFKEVNEAEFAIEAEHVEINGDIERLKLKVLERLKDCATENNRNIFEIDDGRESKDFRGKAVDKIKFRMQDFREVVEVITKTFEWKPGWEPSSSLEVMISSSGLFGLSCIREIRNMTSDKMSRKMLDNDFTVRRRGDLQLIRMGEIQSTSAKEARVSGIVEMLHLKIEDTESVAKEMRQLVYTYLQCDLYACSGRVPPKPPDCAANSWLRNVNSLLAFYNIAKECAKSEILHEFFEGFVTWLMASGSVFDAETTFAIRLYTYYIGCITSWKCEYMLQNALGCYLEKLIEYTYLELLPAGLYMMFVAPVYDSERRIFLEGLIQTKKHIGIYQCRGCFLLEYVRTSKASSVTSEYLSEDESYLVFDRDMKKLSGMVTVGTYFNNGRKWTVSSIISIGLMSLISLEENTGLMGSKRKRYGCYKVYLRVAIMNETIYMEFWELLLLDSLRAGAVFDFIWPHLRKFYVEGGSFDIHKCSSNSSIKDDGKVHLDASANSWVYYRFSLAQDFLYLKLNCGAAANHICLFYFWVICRSKQIASNLGFLQSISTLGSFVSDLGPLSIHFSSRVLQYWSAKISSLWSRMF